MPTRVCRFTGPGAHARIPYPTPLDVVFTAWAPSPPLARQLIGRTGVRAAPLFERHWGSAARWAVCRQLIPEHPCLKGDSSMRTWFRPYEPRSGHIPEKTSQIWSRYAKDMFYCIFAASRAGSTPRRAMVRGLQLGSWGRGAWNLVFNHITRDGEPAGARRGLRGRHRRAPREPAPRLGCAELIHRVQQASRARARACSPTRTQPPRQRQSGREHPPKGTYGAWRALIRPGRGPGPPCLLPRPYLATARATTAPARLG